MSMIINAYRFAAGGGGAFDPLSISWHTAFWAEDPNWTDPGDGNPVSQWDDASGNGRHATQATGSQQPTFRSSDAGYNNKPVVDADGGDLLQTSAFGSPLSQPGTLVVVGSTESNLGVLVTGLTSTARWQLYRADSNQRRHKMYAGSELASGSAGPTAPTLFVATYDGGSSSLERNGSTIMAGNAGSQSLDGLSLFAYLDGTFGEVGRIAFLGLIGRELTSQEKSDLLSWSQSHYGTP